MPVATITSSIPITAEGLLLPAGRVCRDQQGGPYFRHRPRRAPQTVAASAVVGPGSRTGRAKRNRHCSPPNGRPRRRRLRRRGGPRRIGGSCRKCSLSSRNKERSSSRCWIAPSWRLVRGRTKTLTPITLATDLVGITGLRLEVLSDETLPHGGPGRADNGNLHLSEVRVTARAKRNDRAGDADQAKIGHRGLRPEAVGGLPEPSTADPATAWGIYPAVGQSHRAIFEFDQPAGFADGTELTVELDQQHGSGHLIGRFRLAVTTVPAPLKAESQLLPATIDRRPCGFAGVANGRSKGRTCSLRLGAAMEPRACQTAAAVARLLRVETC